MACRLLSQKIWGSYPGRKVVCLLHVQPDMLRVQLNQECSRKNARLETLHWARLISACPTSAHPVKIRYGRIRERTRLRNRREGAQARGRKLTFRVISEVTSRKLQKNETPGLSLKRCCAAAKNTLATCFEVRQIFSRVSKPRPNYKVSIQEIM